MRTSRYTPNQASDGDWSTIIVMPAALAVFAVIAQAIFYLVDGVWYGAAIADGFCYLDQEDWRLCATYRPELDPGINWVGLNEILRWLLNDVHVFFLGLMWMIPSALVLASLASLFRIRA